MTTILDRASRALHAFRQSPQTVKQRITLFPPAAIDQPQQQLTDIESFSEYGYKLNAVIYAACMYKARAISSAPLRAYRGDTQRPTPLDDNHPLSKLLLRPNRYQSKIIFSWLNTIYFNVTGNVFVFFERNRPDQVPKAMYTLRPDRILIVPSMENEQEILGYLYLPPGKTRAEAVPILAEHMMHVRNPNPLDGLGGFGFGMSPLQPVAQSANVDNDVTRFLATFFKKGAMFQNAVSFDLELDPDQIGEVQSQLEERYGGVENWSKWAVLHSGGKIQRVNPTFDEMGFDSIDERNETRILGPIGVPPILIGMRSGLAHATYSNAEEARQVCWEDTLNPEIDLFESEYQYYLTFGETFVRYDKSDVPALRRDIKPLTDAAMNMWRMGVPAKQCFDTVGLDVADFPGQDKSYVNVATTSTMTPAEQQPAIGDNGEPEPVDTEKARVTKAKRQALQATEAHLKPFGDAASRMFEQDKKECQALAHEALKKAYQRKASINWGGLEGDILSYLKNTSTENWRSEFIPLIEGLIKENGDEWAAALGATFDVRNLEGEAWFQDYVLKFSDAISDTSSQAMHDLIAQAMAEGWSVPQMEERMGQIFEQWMNGNLSPEDLDWLKQRMPQWRRELIARTETMRSYNTGYYNLSKRWGATEKSWLNAGDDRVRPSHKETYLSAWIPIDEPFKVGQSQMLHPLDMTLGASFDEVGDCRCSLLTRK